MLSKKALKAYEVQKKLFPIKQQDPVPKQTLPTIVKAEVPINYLQNFMEEKNSKSKINYEKLFWLLSLRIFFLALVVFIFFKFLSI